MMRFQTRWTSIKESISQNSISASLFLVSFQGLIAFWWFVSEKSAAENVILFGLSKQRLAIAAVFAVIIFIPAVIAFWLRKKPTLKAKVENRLDSSIRTRGNYLGLLSLLFGAALSPILAGYIISVTADVAVFQYFLQLIPIFLWLTVILIECVFFIRFRKFGSSLPEYEPLRWISILPIPLTAAILAAFVVTTKIGILSDKYQWLGPGAPLLFWHILLSFTIGVIVLILVAQVVKRFGGREASISRWDLLICLGIWLTAVLLWQGTPLSPNYFNPGKFPPTYEYYPYSDSYNYDAPAYHLMIGDGLITLSDGPFRPLLSAFLALGHVVMGDGYDKIVTWQILFYASFPVVLYLLASAVHNRTSGLLVAGLAIFREATSIALSGQIYISNSKMIMSDFSTMLAVALLTLFMIKWLQEEDSQRTHWLLLVGCILGLAMLIRLQIVVLAIIVIAFIALNHRFEFPFLFRSSGVFILGIMLVVLPWLTRNFFVIGKFSFPDFSTSQAGLLETRYGQSWNDSALDYALQEPASVLSFISSHFFHNQIDSLLILPVNSILFDDYQADTVKARLERNHHKFWRDQFSPQHYIESLPYWPDWDGELPANVYLPLGLNLVLFVIGLSVCWKHNRLAGIFPIFIFFGYLVGLSFFRFNGWRFILPVDWIGYFYYAIGFAQLGIWGVEFFNHARLTNPIFISRMLQTDISPPSPRKFAAIALIFFAISASIPIAEILIPPRYTDSSLESILFSAKLDNSIVTDAQVLQGLALYPRYDPAHRGLLDSQWPSHAPRDYSRMGFILLSNKTEYQVVFPTSKLPTNFTIATDVVVIGCPKEDFFLATKMIIPTGSNQVQVLLADSFAVCP